MKRGVVDMRSGGANDLEESGDEPKVVVDKVKSWRRLDPALVNYGND